MPTLHVYGDIRTPDYHNATQIGRDLAGKDNHLELNTEHFLESDWIRWVAQKKKEEKGNAFQHGQEPMVIHSVEGYIGGVADLKAWAKNKYEYTDSRPAQEYEETATAKFNELLRNSKNKYCFFDVKTGDGEPQRIIFELFSAKCPKTVQNFLALCTGEKGKSEDGVALRYLNSGFHRIVKDAYIQGGDIVTGKGNAGVSIYGKIFADESFTVKHDAPGTLAMANSGPHTNNSQFYIALRELPFLNGKKVAFGRVIVGLNALYAVNEVPTRNQRPTTSVIISDCNEYVA